VFSLYYVCATNRPISVQEHLLSYVFRRPHDPLGQPYIDCLYANSKEGWKSSIDVGSSAEHSPRCLATIQGCMKDFAALEIATCHWWTDYAHHHMEQSCCPKPTAEPFTMLLTNLSRLATNLRRHHPLHGRLNDCADGHRPRRRR